MVLTVPEVTPSLRSFFSSVAEYLSVEIELITISSSLCLSYGFFEKNVSKNLLLMDFGWDSVRVARVEHRNTFQVKNETKIPVLCGFSLFSSIYKSLLKPYVNTLLIATYRRKML